MPLALEAQGPNHWNHQRSPPNSPPWPFLSAQFSGTGYLHTALQPPPPSSPELPHFPKGKRSPLTDPPTQSPWAHHLLPVSVDLTLGTSCGWKRQCLSFCVWLLFLSVTSSGFTNAVSGLRIPSLLGLHNTPPCDWTTLVRPSSVAFMCIYSNNPLLEDK